VRRTDPFIGVCTAILLTSAGLKAQQANSGTTGQAVTMDRLITFNGTLKDSSGQARLGTVAITFGIYTSQRVEIRCGGRVRRCRRMGKAVTLSCWDRLRKKDCRTGIGEPIDFKVLDSGGA